MKQATLFSSTTIAAICESIPACSNPLIFGLERMEKSSLAVALVLSAADRKGFELSMTVRASNDLRNQPGKFMDRHVSGKPMIIDPMGTAINIFTNFRIFGIDT